MSGQRNTPLTFYPWGNNLGSDLPEGWLNPGTGLNDMKKRKTSCLWWNSNRESSIPQPRLIL